MIKYTMEIDQEYLEYAGQASLALLAISASYFMDISNPISYGALALIPALYGYTAYISREKFRPATLMSLVTLIFTPLGITMGFISVFIPLSNILISFFAGGTGFKNYSNSTLLPMLFTGIILGGIIFGAAQSQPEIKQQIVTTAEDVSSKQTEIIMNQTNLKSIQRDAGRQIVETTSSNTIILTQGYVENRTELDPEDQQDVNDAFQSARNELPQRIADRTVERQESLDISGQASRATANLIEANLGIIILLFAISFYMLNPVISIMTAVSGVAFEKFNEQL